MTDKNQKEKRRLLLKGVGGGAVLAVWHKPVINTVVTPAHAQTSNPPPPPTAAEACPMISIGNVISGPVSGTNTPPVCTVTFDVLSSDAAQDLTISAIETGTLPANVTVDVQDLGTATTTSGPRVVWTGPASDAPFCTDVMPTEDVSFEITATCSAATLMDTFTQTFSLNNILQL